MCDILFEISEKVPRACIIVIKSTDAILISKLYSRDLTVIKARLRDRSGERL